MNNTIQDLAMELNVPAEVLISWYSSRAIHEFWSVALALGIALLSYRILLTLNRMLESERYKDADDDEKGAITCLMVLAVIFLLTAAAITPIVLYGAIIAVASPEAYAVEEIIEMLKEH